MTAPRKRAKALGQSYQDRVAAGRRSVSVWLLKGAAADLDWLGERWGMAWPRDVITKALQMARKIEER